MDTVGVIQSASTTTSSINEGGLVTLDGSASIDCDGNSLVFQWSQVSGLAVTLSSPTSVGSGFTAPTVSSNSTVVIRLSISQGGRSESTDINISVRNIVTPAASPPKTNAG